ncbi:MAG: PorV/PorQ family protein [Bacteroidetes bacterium]|nr:PorV/PorQ family protein [Bacteroidota bacterium]
MKKVKNRIIVGLLVAGMGLISTGSFAGNPERSGAAGATELLINPFARSAGWGGANTAGVRGLDAQFWNVAGLAFTKKTEIAFNHTQWLKGSGININSFGLAQHVGQSGVIGIGIMSMGFGDIEYTTTDLPEGGIGTFSPQFFNMGLSYSKEFSNSIYGGITLRVISEAIADVKTQGLGFDAGIQYVTGFNPDKDNLKFGISLRNVSAPLKYSGDGLAIRGTLQNGATLGLEQKSGEFELPSLINIGVSYDFKLAEMHRLTTAFNFTANSFSQNQYILGLEYGFKSLFMLRAGYVYEGDVTDSELRTTALTGLNVGLSFELPLGKSGKAVGLDYAYRATNPFDGCHSIGARLRL